MGQRAAAAAERLRLRLRQAEAEFHALVRRQHAAPRRPAAKQLPAPQPSDGGDGGLGILSALWHGIQPSRAEDQDDDHATAGIGIAALVWTAPQTS